MKTKKTLKYSFVAILAIIALLLCTGYYVLGYALQPELLKTRSRDLTASYAYMVEEYPELESWVDSLIQNGALRDWYIENDRGEQLHAFYVRAAQPTRRTAVIVHGYTDNAIRMMHIGYMYSRRLGYNILLPDLHAHGLSEGTAIQMGWLDRLDVLQWTETADELFGREQGGTQMVVHGISMGAATTMMLSGEVQQGANLHPYIKCFVEDCGYTSVWDEFKSELKTQFHLPAFPLLHTTNLLAQWEYGWNFREASALEQVRKCTLPMLFIHGDDDDFVPTWMVHPLYEAKPGPKELWLAPGSAHAFAYKDHPDEYTARVKAFTEKYID